MKKLTGPQRVVALLKANGKMTRTALEKKLVEIYRVNERSASNIISAALAHRHIGKDDDGNFIFPPKEQTASPAPSAPPSDPAPTQQTPPTETPAQIVTNVADLLPAAPSPSVTPPPSDVPGQTPTPTPTPAPTVTGPVLPAVEPSQSAPNFNDVKKITDALPPPTEKPVFTDNQYKALASMGFEIYIGSMGAVFDAEEWQPSSEREKSFVVDSIAKYLESQQITEPPPWAMALIALGMYSAPRLARPKTKAKLQEIFGKKKAKPAELTAASTVTTPGAPVGAASQPTPQPLPAEKASSSAKNNGGAQPAPTPTRGIDA